MPLQSVASARTSELQANVAYVFSANSTALDQLSVLHPAATRDHRSSPTGGQSNLLCSPLQVKSAMLSVLK